MLSGFNWPLINSFAGWLSAIGTLLAVIVSLRLARRDSRVRLKVSVGLRRVFTTEQAPIEGRDFIVIDVTNVGRRGATVVGLFWKNTLVRKLYVFQVLGRAPLSAQLPLRLQDGDEGGFTVDLKSFMTNDPATFSALFPWPKLFSAKFLSMQVRISTGEIFRAPVEKELRKWLLEYIEGKAQATITTKN